MKLYVIIRAAGRGRIVEALAKEAGLGRDQTEQALRTLLPEFGRAIRKTTGGAGAAPALLSAMQDERYARYLDHPAALREAAAVADGDRVLGKVLDDEQRDDLVRITASAIHAEQTSVRRLLPLVATLAVAALRQQTREESPQIPWFGTRPGDHFDAPLLNALAAMFEHEDEAPPESQ